MEGNLLVAFQCTVLVSVLHVALRRQLLSLFWSVWLSAKFIRSMNQWVRQHTKRHLLCLNTLQRSTHKACAAKCECHLSQWNMRKSWFIVSAGTFSSPQDFQDFQVFRGFTVAIVWNLEHCRVAALSVTNRFPPHQCGCLVAIPSTHMMRDDSLLISALEPRHRSQVWHWLVSHCSPNVH